MPAETFAEIIPRKQSDYKVLGVRISALAKAEWIEVVRGAIADRSRAILISQNLHSAFLCRKHPDLAAFQSGADVVRIDGMPLVFVSRLLGLPVHRKHRAGFMDVLPDLLSTASDEGWSIFYVGGKPGMAERATKILTGRYPGLLLEQHHGYFDMASGSPEVTALLERINSANPDILLVGMGMPRQERFLMAHGQSIASPVLLTCGAALDYVAGEIPMAPRWLSAIGLEWLFRLLAEPARLWQRYLLEPLALFGPLVADLANRNKGVEFFRWQHENQPGGKS